MSAAAVLSILTIISSVVMRISPAPDYYWIHKNKRTGEVALFPVIALFVNSGCVAAYAYMISEFVPLFLTNVFGIFTTLFFTWVFYVNSNDKPYVLKMLGAGVFTLLVIVLYTVLAATGVTHETRDHAGKVLGWAQIVTCVVQFASPLATLLKVIRTKSNASLPLMMCIMNFVNTSLWLSWAAAKSNMFVFAPNVAGVALGISQVTLWYVYRAPKAVPTKKLRITDTAVGDSVVIEMSRSERNTLERVPSYISTSGTPYVAVQSPIQIV